MVPDTHATRTQATCTRADVAQASQEADRTKILNTIAGRKGAELEAPVLEHHDSYKQLNQMLAGRFAATLFRPFLDAGRPVDRCLECVKHSKMRILDLELETCEAFDGLMAGRLFSCLPDTLATLNLGSSLRDRRGEASPGNEHANALASFLEATTSLKTLSADLSCVGKQGVIAICKALGVNASLTDLELRLSFMGPEGGVTIGEALKVNPSLISLNIYQGRIGNEGAIAIAKALEVNTSLTECDLRHNFETEGWCAIFEALRRNPQNQIAKWDLSENSGPPSIDAEVAKSLAALWLYRTQCRQLLVWVWVCTPHRAEVGSRTAAQPSQSTSCGTKIHCPFARELSFTIPQASSYFSNAFLVAAPTLKTAGTWLPLQVGRTSPGLRRRLPRQARRGPRAICSV